MLKPNIKIILAGLFSLLLIALVYCFLGVKKEIISDESQRVEESPLLGLKSQSAQVVNAPKSNKVVMTEREIEFSLERKLVDQPVANYREELITQGSKEAISNLADIQPKWPPEGEWAEPTVDVAGMSINDEITTQVVSPFIRDAVARFEVDNKKVSEGKEFLSFDATEERSSIIESWVEDGMLEITEKKPENDDVIVPEATDFIDFILEEGKPIRSKVLVEDAPLIMNDVNESIVQYNSDAMSDKAETQLMLSSKPSVFVVPQVDQTLMQGDGMVSNEYRQAMTKLVSINAKLSAADEENAQLRTQFEMSVANNRQLAQIIRDIDDQIKASTLTN